MSKSTKHSKPSEMSFTLSSPTPQTGIVPVEKIQGALSNLGFQLSPQDLLQLHVPSGGGLQWSLPTLEGEDMVLSALDCVILHTHAVRRYWATRIEDSGSVPPDCQSNDGVFGLGDPGGDCTQCPMNAWGSKEGGLGKACAQRTHMYLWHEPAGHLPILFDAAPTAGTSIRGYLIRLAAAGLAPYEVVTRITLARMKSAQGIVYSVPELKLYERLENPHEFAGYAAMLRQVAQTAQAGPREEE